MCLLEARGQTENVRHLQSCVLSRSKTRRSEDEESISCGNPGTTNILLQRPRTPYRDNFPLGEFLKYLLEFRASNTTL